MTIDDPSSKLKELLNLSNENEIVEFKTAATSFDFDALGQYFSALSNEANLINAECGWLVFGIDKNHQVVGTKYKNNPASLQQLKHDVAQHTTERLSFLCVHELIESGKRVLMFQIPPARRGIPMAWKGHYYGRDGESLTGLNILKIEEIRSQSWVDWTSEIVPEASLSDLDEDALAVAREKYKERSSGKPWSNEIDALEPLPLLDRAKITKGGRITRAALLLLGKSQSSHLLAPHPAQIVWKLDSDEKAFERFDPPFLLTTTAVSQHIRNIKQKLFPSNQLLATEIFKYDTRVILEALHNCLAHQDYFANERIIVTEKADRVIFQNAGGFFDGTAEDYFEGEKTPSKYRNKWLANAMVELQMIDTAGYGIRTMVGHQIERYLPLPDYSESKSDRVVLKVFGRPIDEKYTHLLLEKKDLSISTVILLDRVQKGLAISDDGAKLLRRQKLIEGNKPRYRVAAEIAAATMMESEYKASKGLDNDQLKRRILNYLKERGSASRSEIDDLTFQLLSVDLDETQKQRKIHNLLSDMSRRDKTIQSTGRGPAARWILVS